MRPLSRVASDYFSDSVVALEVLRPLRPLREIKIIAFCISRKDRKERRDLFPFLFHACAGVVANFVTTLGEGSILQKTFKSLFAHYRAENPRIVKARFSHGISHEHERAGA